jgi:nicotinate-nucleotide adenylyltransferase
LPRWKDIDRLLGMVRLVVLYRDTGGAVPAQEEIGGQMVQVLATRRIDVSSTEIRARVRDGRSIRGFVPDAVATYIASTGLYHENSRAPERADS